MKKVFDEIHGYITLNDLETKIIDSPVFQRLRRIKQTSLAYLVYPGAMHTRFSHSLGTFYLSQKVGEKLQQSGIITSEELNLIRLSSLLHDIGQFPFSHAIEPLYLQLNLSNKILRDEIIRNDGELKEIFEEYSVDVGKILQIYNGDNSFSSIIDSDVDVDRMDYLIRDSRHTGVQLGNLDLERLIDTISYGEDGNIIVLEKGLYSLENFYISRLHMYQAVYYHKTILGYEIYLRHIFKQVVELCCPELFNTSYIKKSVNEGSLVYWDDEWVFSKLYEALSDYNTPDNLKLQIKNFLNRNGPKVVFEEVTFDKLTTPLEELVSKLERYGIPRDAIFPFEEKIKIIDKSKIKVLSKGKYKSLRDLSSTLLKSIPEYINIGRIYVDYKFVNRARDILS
ncbi:HD domain-containing protein [Stygiolobus azoricus]|uniref:HD domain-containing protein n=1 Tax=Stygiolobus azoricus TaxID=41675 RepID=A0A650CNK0_9CREN|nr:HD domain-containing protein [Stygiolobus azoricus]QGR19409.1 HD domain-containing protein [Stygiolobus azoricus]